MTALLAAELLKFWTTRARWAYLAVLVLLSGIGVAGEVGPSDDVRRGDPAFQLGLVEIAGISGLLALILGITVVTSEYRHGTITPTYLVTPGRDRVLAAKALGASVLAVAFTVVSLLVIFTVGATWLTAVGAELHLADVDVAELALKTVLAAVLSALFGVGIGAVVESQVGALLGTLVWIFVLENLLWGLFALLDLDGVVPYLPFRALDATDGIGGEDLLDFRRGVLVTLAWIAAVGAAGVVATRRRDIT